MTAASPPPPATGLLHRLARDTAGNTMAIVAASVLPLLAMIGGGIDMGRAYLSESRLQQACDAGVLAARKKLGAATPTGGLPADVDATGRRFFDLNFRSGAYGSENLTFAMSLEADNSIAGVATVDVPTAIMGVFGNDNVPVAINCTARLNFSNMDVMMVLDTTTSMNDRNHGDPSPRIVEMKNVVRNFHSTLEAAKTAGTRIRYGFVPYSTNVNVGGILKDEWVAPNWTYQSRDNNSVANQPGTRTTDENWTWISGTYATSEHGQYASTLHPPANEWGSAYRTCDTAPPASTSNATYTLVSTTTEPYAGPPAGTKTIEHYRRVVTGTYYWVTLSGTQCIINRADYGNLTHEYDHITTPWTYAVQMYRYAPIARDVSNWRTAGNGCMEERATYEIDDYDNVDFTRALDLDIDLVPTAGDPDTQWKPSMPAQIWERSLGYYGNSGALSYAPVVTADAWLYKPTMHNSLVACPASARKLAEMSAAQVSTYLGTINALGTTYHDIGMIWGGRLISPTGLFAAENADVNGRPTRRHLIFLTDGITEPFDVAYGAYGVEPLDRRRWQPASPLTLKQTVEARFAVACQQVRNRNVTIWVVGFGTTMTDLMKQCAGDGHWFQADDSSQLNDVFQRIARAMGELRIAK